MFFKSKKVLGLDIGTSSIKIAEVTASGSSATLEGFSFVQTPPSAVQNGELLDVSALSITIQSLVSELKTKRKNMSTGMWGTAVIIKKISVPKADVKMIGEQLGFYAEQYIPFEVKNVTLTHSVLKKSASPDTAEVLLVAAQNELVNQYETVINMAGLNCSILDVSGFALANCFEINYGISSNETIGLINIGGTVSNFAILSGGEVIFCRDIPVGGFNYTNEISKALALTPEEAEALKLNASAKGEGPSEIQSVITATNDMIAEEVRNSLDFLSATSASANFGRIFYTGGASATPGLIEAIQKANNLRAEPFNPFRKVKVNPRRLSQSYVSQVAPFASIAIGLGLRSAGDS